MQIGEWAAIQQASNLDQLYLGAGGISKRPEGVYSLVTLFRKVYLFFLRIHDYLWPDYSIEQRCINRVVDLLLVYEGSEPALVAQKVEAFVLGRHFDLRKRQDLNWHELAELAWIRKTVERAGGATGGAYFLNDPRNGDRIGIFKIDEGFRHWKARIEQVVKEMVGQRSYLKVGHVEAQAEEAAYLLERHLITQYASLLPFSLQRIELIPSASVQEFAGVKGCLQRCAKGFVDKEHWLSKAVYEEKEIQIFQLFACLDFILGNQDRHEDNWFISLHENELEEIQAIDNANTFPQRAAKSRFFKPPSHQYAWAKERIAEHPFQGGLKRWAEQAFSESSFLLGVQCIEQRFSSFLTPEMKEQMRRRFAILSRLVQRQDFTVRTLLLYREEQQIQSFLAREP